MNVDHDLEYAEACYPDRIKLVGVTVGPFTVGHQLLLKRMKSPFICDGEYNLADFLTALWVCSHGYVDGESGLFSKPLGIKFWSWRMTMRLKKFNLIEVANALGAYIAESMRTPDNFFMSVNSSRTATPLTLLLFKDLAGPYGYTWEAFLRQPMRKVIYERFGLFVSAHDRSIGWSFHKKPKKEELSHGE